MWAASLTTCRFVTTQPSPLMMRLDPRACSIRLTGVPGSCAVVPTIDRFIAMFTTVGNGAATRSAVVNPAILGQSSAGVCPRPTGAARPTLEQLRHRARSQEQQRGREPEGPSSASVLSPIGAAPRPGGEDRGINSSPKPSQDHKPQRRRGDGHFRLDRHAWRYPTQGFARVLEHDLHRNALDHLDKVPRGVLWR